MHGQVMCAYLTKGPLETVDSLGVVRMQSGETRAFGEKGARGDANGEGWVFSLEEAHDAFDRIGIGTEMVKEMAGGCRTGARSHGFSKLQDAAPRKEAQGQFQSGIELDNVTPCFSKKARQAGCCRIWSIQLHHGRRDQQNAHYGATSLDNFRLRAAARSAEACISAWYSLASSATVR